MEKILSGIELSEKIITGLEEKIKNLDKKPGLAVIIVGEDPPSKIYVARKIKACGEIGIISKKFEFSSETSQKEIIDMIISLNNDSMINGILVQLPLPSHINQNDILDAINPLKDVDCFHPNNMGNFFLGKKVFVPCTPKGIVKLLEESGIHLEGKDVVVIGRSNIVGKPLIPLLLEKNATVTSCHSKTNNLKEKTLRADILIVAIGKPLFITADMVKEGAIIIDVGINRIPDPENEKGYRIVGDVDFKNVQKKVACITPVPRGVGPMTIAMLLENTLMAYKLQNPNL